MPCCGVIDRCKFVFIMHKNDLSDTSRFFAIDTRAETDSPDLKVPWYTFGEFSYSININCLLFRSICVFSTIMLVCCIRLTLPSFLKHPVVLNHHHPYHGTLTTIFLQYDHSCLSSSLNFRPPFFVSSHRLCIVIFGTSFQYRSEWVPEDIFQFSFAHTHRHFLFPGDISQIREIQLYIFLLLSVRVCLFAASYYLGEASGTNAQWPICNTHIVYRQRSNKQI